MAGGSHMGVTAPRCSVDPAASRPFRPISTRACHVVPPRATVVPSARRCGLWREAERAEDRAPRRVARRRVTRQDRGRGRTTDPLWARPAESTNMHNRERTKFVCRRLCKGARTRPRDGRRSGSTIRRWFSWPRRPRPSRGGYGPGANAGAQEGSARKRSTAAQSRDGRATLIARLRVTRSAGVPTRGCPSAPRPVTRGRARAVATSSDSGQGSSSRRSEAGITQTDRPLRM